MSYRYEVSYPFMTLARVSGAEYGDVLRAAQWIDDGEAGECPVDELQVPVWVMEEVHALLAQPVHLRGGRMDVCDACGRTFSGLELEQVREPETLCPYSPCPIANQELDRRPRA